MGQKFSNFEGGGFSSAIDDFEITVQGEALRVGLVERERVRDGQTLMDARTVTIREAVLGHEVLRRIVRLEGAEHATARADLIAEILASASPLRPGQARKFAEPGGTFWAKRVGECVVVWGAGSGESEPVYDPASLPSDGFRISGAALEIGRERREFIAFPLWREGEVVEAVVDGRPVCLRRAGWRLQVWGMDDRALPYVPRMAPFGGEGPLGEYEVVASGEAVNIGRLDRSERDRDPEAHAEVRHRLLRDALARLHADRKPFGWRSRNRIDGVECEIRRDGWRLQVWGAGEGEPAIDERPAPPGADPPGEDVPAARMAIADFDVNGRAFRKAKPSTPAQHAKQKEILEQLAQAERDHLDAEVERLKREFYAAHTFEDEAPAPTAAAP